MSLMEKMVDDEFGLLSPDCVFNRDQVPIELRTSSCRTIDERGVISHSTTLSIQPHIHVCVCVCIHMYVCTCVYMFVHVCVCVCKCV